MNRKLMLMTVAIIATATAQAQYVTYNHDSPKQNQITVMETGAGSLTPELYYWALHNKYKKSAAAKNKLGFRTTAGINLYNQTGAPLRTGNAGRNTTMFSSAPLMLPGMPICPMRSGRKSICESTKTWCSRMRFLSAISPNGRMPP